MPPFPLSAGIGLAAKPAGQPLLFVGDDFRQTDLEVAAM